MKWCIKIAASDVLSVASCVFCLSFNGCKYMDFFVKIPKKTLQKQYYLYHLTYFLRV